MMFILILILMTLFVPSASPGPPEQLDISLDSGIKVDACSFILKSRSLSERCKEDSLNQCDCVELKAGLVIDCSGRNLTRIPDPIPTKATVLLLNRNCIEEVPNNVFENNTSLKHLDLSYNNISAVMINSFKYLHKLQTLLLQHNRLRYTEDSLPSIVFQHLEKLSCLRIEQRGVISDVEDYPIQSLTSLKNLQILFMDGLPNRTFSKNFSYLTNLQMVVLTGITGRCNLTSVTKEGFVFLSHIEHLALLNCSLTKIESGSFEEMKYLQSLNLSYNTELHFQSMRNISYGLTKLLRFRSLNLTKIHSTFGRCTYLDSQMLQYFNQTTVQELVLDSNRLSTLDADALDFLPKSLTYLSVANNKLDIDSYLLNLLCDFDGILPNINTLIVSWQNSKTSIGELFRTKWSKQTPYFENQMTNRKSNWFSRISSKFINPTECISYILQRCSCLSHIHKGPCPWPSLGENCMYPFPLLLPPYLKHVDFSGSDYRISLEEVCLCANNTLTDLNMKGNLVYSFPGPFYGFEHLKTLDLGKNYCNNITEASFENMPNLRKLNLSSNYLGQSINSTITMLPFKNQQKLTHLDLSNNKLRSLPKNIFSNLLNLKYLYLSENRLSKINVSIDQLKKIKVLDLSNNLLETITEDVRVVLDYAYRHNHARINMTQNKFTCNCKYQDFIEWMTQNRGMFVNFDDYYCSFDNEDRHYLKDSSVIDRLRNMCTNYIPLILGTSFCIGFVIIILVSVISYRYRWHIRYMYYSAKFRYNGYKRVDEDDHFVYDIFVSYADADKHFVLEQMVPELEGNRQLRLLVHERDFPFGQLITENIHRAISSSRRTMLVVSPSFLASKWCKYEMNIAKVEGINRDKDVLCVVMKNSVPVSKLPLELMEIIAKNTYLSIPTDPELFTGLWDSIEALIH